MKKKLIINLIISVFLLFSVSVVRCETGADFLKIGVGARPIAMGNAFVGIANDVTSLYYNPAGLVQLNMNEISAMHNQWLADTAMDFVGVGVPVDSPFSKGRYRGIYDRAILAFGLVNLSYGQIEGRDENRQQTGSFNAADTCFTLAYSKYMSSVLSYGVNVKFLQQKIESVSATGVAFDLGMLYKFGIRNLQLGFAVQNIGAQMKFLNDGYNLPLSVSVGLGYAIGGITIGFDVKNYIYEGQTVIGFGTEYMPVTALALRAGYLTQLLKGNSSVLRSQAGTSFGSNDINGLGAGLGFRLFNIQTDYSFIPYGELGNTQRISFSSRF